MFNKKIFTLKLQFIKNRLFVIQILILTILIYSCNKEPDLLGSDIQPPSDKLNLSFTDSVAIIAYSVKEDTINTNGLSQNVIGWLNDPIFGKIQAGIATQLNLSSRSVSFGTDAQVDSVVLVIAFRGFYGDTNAAVNFKVYEINEDLNVNNSYNQNHTLNYFSKPLNNNPNEYITSRINTVQFSNSDTVLPAFRIRLTNEWAKRKIIDKSGSPEIDNNDNFKAYCKGIYITAENAYKLGHLLYLGINKSIKSGIFVYYHNSTGVKDPFQLIVEDDCARINLYNHFNYTGAVSDLQNQINGNTLLGAEKIYLQPLGGINAKIYFPNIKNRFNRRRVVINKAELVIKNLIPNYRTLYVPAKLTLAKNTSTGSYQYLPDDALIQGESYFGGQYNNTKNEYRFRITRYIQQLIDSNNDDYGITLFVSGRSVVANRLVLGGYNPTIISKNDRLRLELSYTFLD